MDKYILYDTTDVVEGEHDFYCEKYGSEPSFEKIYNFMKCEFEIFKDEIDRHDEEKLDNRIDLTVEDENGEIWVCVKMFNINRLRKLLGTES